MCGDGRLHGFTRGKEARSSAVYPFKLCQAILHGFANQLEAHHRTAPGVHCLLLRGDGEIESRAVMHVNSESGMYRDSITGQPLVPALVEEARKKELQYFEEKKVWELRDRTEAVRRQGKPPISVRWVDVNKGDDEEPCYRSRLVAREIRRAGRTLCSLLLRRSRASGRLSASQLRTCLARRGTIGILPVTGAHKSSSSMWRERTFVRRRIQRTPLTWTCCRRGGQVRAVAMPHVWHTQSWRRLAL